MARRTKEFTIDDRGTKHTFLMTEFSAVKLEDLIVRAGLIFLNSGVNIPGGMSPDDLKGMAMALSNMAESDFKLNINIPYEKFRPLYDELLTCCQWKNPASTAINKEHWDAVSLPLLENIFLDVRSLLRLRKEVLYFHFSFFANAAGSKSPASDTAAVADTVAPQA